MIFAGCNYYRQAHFKTRLISLTNNKVVKIEIDILLLELNWNRHVSVIKILIAVKYIWFELSWHNMCIILFEFK